MPDTTDGPENTSGELPELPDAAAQTEDTDRTGSSDLERTDGAWQQIVAELSDLSTNLEGELTALPPATAPAFNFPVAPWVDEPSSAATTGRTWQRTPEAEALDEAEGEFVPPDPGFKLSTDPLRNLGWAVVVGAPVLAIGSLLWQGAPSWTISALATAFLAGAGLLLWRLPKQHDDGPASGDGGAVV